MRLSSQKILLALLPVGEVQPLLTSTDQLRLLVPKLTVQGFSSLIALLIRRHWLNPVSLSSKTHVQITQSGIEAISGQFPVFKSHSPSQPSDWYLVLFSEPTKGDPAFRYLRRLLLSQGGMSLGRGQYAFSQDIPDVVEQTLRQLYREAVYVCRVSDWREGFISPRILAQKVVSEQLTALSGISKQINYLLNKKTQQNRLTFNDKKTIADLFEQLAITLTESGLRHWLDLPQVESPSQILTKLQQILLL